MIQSDNINVTKSQIVKLFCLIFLASLILGYFSPWWIGGLVALISSLWLAKSAIHAFAVSSAALAILWSLLASYWHFSSNGILSEKVASMFKLPNGVTLIIVVFIIAGLVGGLSGLCGFLFKKLFN